MVTRWMRRQGAGGDIDVMLERLAIIDETVMQLVAEVYALEEREPPDDRQRRGDSSKSR
ncbi:MAG TPA: hypothetical protein VGR22_04885 [Thermomicrobiales bacterium]|nr:hypothetical protein [Thermomicrobiales bacterium]